MSLVNGNYQFHFGYEILVRGSCRIRMVSRDKDGMTAISFSIHCRLYRRYSPTRWLREASRKVPTNTCRIEARGGTQVSLLVSVVMCEWAISVHCQSKTAQCPSVSAYTRMEELRNYVRNRGEDILSTVQ